MQLYSAKPPTQRVPLQRHSRPCTSRFRVSVVRAVQTASREQEAYYQRSTNPQSLVAHQSDSSELVPVAFRWPGQLGGSSVIVQGSWDGWATACPLVYSECTRDWVRVVQLPPGQHEYKFQVDGDWKAAPCDPIVHSATGHVNNKRVVAANVRLELPGLPTDEVLILGSFSGWKEAVPLHWSPQRQRHVATLCLGPGTHTYRACVNGHFKWADDVPHTKVLLYSGTEVIANVIEVPPLPAFHLCYASGWATCSLVYRFKTDAQDGEWQELVMDNAPSRARPVGGRWKQAIVPLPPALQAGDAAAVSLEFWVRGPAPDAAAGGGAGAQGGRASGGTHGGGGWAAAAAPEDRGPEGCGYTLRWPGGYKLVKGVVRKAPRVESPPIMLCSDLDGTMVGDAGDAAADARTKEFTEYWEDEAALARSVLVYNTGRSRGDTARLLEDKAAVLAVPDVLITAVGTKIWHLPDKSRGFTDAADLTWVEDTIWAARLDQGWDIDIVRSLGRDAHNEFNHRGSGEQVKWLDKGEEHRHRIALQAAARVTPQLKDWMQARLAERNIQAVVIVSGQGDWRYVDIVAAKAGKLQALEWVRTMYGVPEHRCVTAGDSGNDILMLNGSMPAIIVGNAQPELLDWYQQQPPRAAHGDASVGTTGGEHSVLITTGAQGSALVVAGGKAGGGRAAGGAPSVWVSGGGSGGGGGAGRRDAPRIHVTQAQQAAGILEGLSRHGLRD